MSRGTEFTGKNVEAAVQAAVEALGKPRDALEIQVLSQGSRGVFGLGGEPARVLVRDPSAPEQTSPSEPPPAVRTAPPKVSVQREEVSAEVEPAPVSTSTAVMDTEEEGGLESGSGQAPASDEVIAAAQEILGNILSKMGFEVETVVRSREEPVTLEVRGDNLGVLIGRRGDSLSALQFMVNVILSKQFHEWPRVVVDVQGYRARREQSLSTLGLRVADRVRRNKRPFTLEAMPASDRRIIHLALRERSDVETYSVGEGPARRVVIAPKR